MEKSYNYSDVYLIPKYSELKTRNDADISVEFLGRKFKAPWMPANMASVISIENAKWLSENDYFYIMHRFGDNLEFIKKANKENWKLISISVGVKEDDKQFLEQIARSSSLRIDYITIDIAHGHSILMKEMIEFINSLKFGFNIYNYYDNSYKPKIIAGNVCTPEAVLDLANWGADAVKVGIAGGGVCSTKNMTGFHIPMFSCVNNICNPPLNSMGPSFKRLYDYPKVPIIADGGIRENGDIAKALVAGATMTMAGSIFAACVDAPGENIYEEIGTGKGTNLFINERGMTESGIWREEKIKKIVKKRYYGSASAKNKKESNQEVKHVEGFEIELPCNGLTYEEKYKEITDSLKSAISYSGGNNLDSFKSVKYVVVK